MEVTAWIAFGALLFAGMQAWIAYRKLRFDLFAKRFETWEALNDAINERRNRQHLDLSLPYEGDDPTLIRTAGSRWPAFTSAAEPEVCGGQLSGASWDGSDKATYSAHDSRKMLS